MFCIFSTCTFVYFTILSLTQLDDFSTSATTVGNVRSHFILLHCSVKLYRQSVPLPSSSYYSPTPLTPTEKQKARHTNQTNPVGSSSAEWNKRRPAWQTVSYDMVEWRSVWKWMRRARRRYYRWQHEGAEIASGTYGEQWQSIEVYYTSARIKTHVRSGSGSMESLAGGLILAAFRERSHPFTWTRRTRFHLCTHKHRAPFAHIDVHAAGKVNTVYLSEVLIFYCMCTCICHYLLQQLLLQQCHWHPFFSCELFWFQMYLPKTCRERRTRENSEETSIVCVTTKTHWGQRF